MPFLEEKPRFRGITLPPSGWVLTVLLAIYILPGLIGHDPWKNDDAITIGIAYDIATNNNWLVLQAAGRIYPDAPLYYWLAAIVGKFFSWLLPFHDAARMTSGLYTLLSLEFVLLAARELHGREYAAVAPLTLAGSIGFLFHAHEAQPMLAALAAHTAAYWALALLPRRPYRAGIIFGSAVSMGFLANGFLPTVTLLPVLVIALWQFKNLKASLVFLLIGGILATAIPGAWLVSLYRTAPEYLESYLKAESATFAHSIPFHTNVGRYLNLLLWYAWPALPLAGWALWAKRRTLLSLPVALPLLSFIGVLAILGWFTSVRSSIALLLLPPLVLLAVPGVATLRRGAASAFDWFAMMTFTFFAGIAWLGWSTLVLGWPERLANRAVRLEPGFVIGNFNAMAFFFALTFTAIWFWMIVTSPRSPMRGVMHWMYGLTLFWLLVASLWMPWIDYGKTFRPLTASLNKALPEKVDCVASAGLQLSFLASLDYFQGIRTVPQKSEAAKRCSWLLVQGGGHNPATLVAAGWRQVWEGNRPTDRRDEDKFHLYRRGKKADPAPALTDLNADADDKSEALAPDRIPPE